MLECKIIFSSDLHGNERQFEKLVELARKVQPYAVINGGDICPKDSPKDSLIKHQRRFLKTSFPQLMKRIKDASAAKVFLLTGNDDCAGNWDVLEKHDGQLYSLIHGRRLKLNEEFDIAGYSIVPVTPFGIKDWEKHDLSSPPPHLLEEYALRKKTNYKMHGFKSHTKAWEAFSFTEEMEAFDSIEKDLEKEPFASNHKKTVYVMHTPPNGTKLDIAYKYGHVGSFAARLFIEKHQPYLTLHGHIHESAGISGSFMDRIGQTFCIASGNHNAGELLSAVVFDIHKPGEAKRVVL